MLFYNLIDYSLIKWRKKKNLTNESPPIIYNQYKNISLKKPSIIPKLKYFEFLKAITSF